MFFDRFTFHLIALPLMAACQIQAPITVNGGDVSQGAEAPKPGAPMPPPGDVYAPPSPDPTPQPSPPHSIDAVTPKERIGDDAMGAFSVQGLSLFDDDAPYLRRPISAIWPGVVEEMALDAGSIHLIVNGVHYRLERLADIGGKARGDDPTDSYPAWAYIDSITWITDYAASARICIDGVYSCVTVTTVLSE